MERCVEGQMLMVIITLMTLDGVMSQMLATPASLGTNGSESSLVLGSSVRRERVPPFHMAVWDEQGNVCIMAKLEASFTINYETQYGTQQMIDRLVSDPLVVGRCESVLDEMPVIDIKWRGGFVFRLIFDKNVFENTWKIQTMELLYNTADSLFRDSIKGEQVLAKSKNLDLAAFETSLDKSYFCPTTPTLNLYDIKNGKAVVLVRLFNVQIQAFKIKGSKFSTIQHCGQVGFGSGVASPFLQNDNGVIVVTFSVYIFASVMTVLGYAGYRTWFVKNVSDNYGAMA